MAFQPGQSGNRSGRPPGTPDKRTKCRELLQPHAAALIKKAVDMALGGDVTALRMCLDRVCPPLKPQTEPIVIDMQGDDVTTLAAEVFRAATAGEISLDEAGVMTSMLLNQARIADVDEANRNAELALRKVKSLNNDMEALHLERVETYLKSRCAQCTKKRR